jgi:hypothetical protein
MQNAAATIRALKSAPVNRGPTSREERREIVRDQKGVAIGSRVDVIYHYGEEESDNG